MSYIAKKPDGWTYTASEDVTLHEAFDVMDPSRKFPIDPPIKVKAGDRVNVLRETIEIWRADDSGTFWIVAVEVFR